MNVRKWKGDILMREFFRPWTEIHLPILYILLFALQIGLYLIARRKKQDRYWISLFLLQICSILLVIFGNNVETYLLSFPINFFSGMVALPIYGIFFFVALSMRAGQDDMPRTKVWNRVRIAAYCALLIPIFLRMINAIIIYIINY